MTTRPWHHLLLGALVAGAVGCSGLSPQDDDPTPGAGCPGSITVFNPLNGALGPVGTDSTLDLATWNMEFFPLASPYNFDCPHPNSTARIQKMAELINTLNIDVIAVQEVSEPGGFEDLLALCPNFGGALVPEFHGCNYQRTGVIYRKDIATLHSFRTLNELGVFTREPFEADLTVTQNGRPYRFRLVVLHLKAGGEEDAPRRRTETNALHAYLESRALADPGVDYVVAGDWNDVLTEGISNTSFPAFLADLEDFSFLTDVLKTRSDMASHAGGRLIDLLLVNRNACPDFTGARVTTLRLDLIVPNYSGLVSDHRPVLVSAPIFN